MKKSLIFWSVFLLLHSCVKWPPNKYFNQRPDTIVVIEEQVEELEPPPIVAPVDLALQYYDLEELQHRETLTAFLEVDPVAVEWCAAFVNAVLEKTSNQGTDDDVRYLARSFLKWGMAVEEPKFGDVVVFSRGEPGWQGHVGFYLSTKQGQNGEEYYLVLGGNQSDRVSIDWYTTSSLLGIRRLEGTDS